MADAIDTWDKCALWLVKGGQDEFLGSAIKDHLMHPEQTHFESSREEFLDFVYLSAVSPRKPHKDPDSSQRYFLQVDPKTELSAMRTHISFARHMRNYIQKRLNSNWSERKDKTTPGQPIGFNRVWNRTFFHQEIKPRMISYFKGEMPDI